MRCGPSRAVTVRSPTVTVTTAFIAGVVKKLRQPRRAAQRPGVGDGRPVPTGFFASNDPRRDPHMGGGAVSRKARPLAVIRAAAAQPP